ncbi:hypothetical protein TNCV_4045291 [Trichonephila clavipes]|nr:hypothetical protein TNCV_4045291 [Trichonephila clavipes]
MAIMMIDYDTTADDSADFLRSKADILKDAVSVTPPQPSAVKWWKATQRSIHFVDKFIAAAIAASNFVQLCLYVAGDDLLLGLHLNGISCQSWKERMELVVKAGNGIWN